MIAKGKKSNIYLYHEFVKESKLDEIRRHEHDINNIEIYLSKELMRPIIEEIFKNRLKGRKHEKKSNPNFNDPYVIGLRKLG